MTLLEALEKLMAAQMWMRLGVGKDGRPYGPGYFRKYPDYEKFLQYENRRITLRLAHATTCTACGGVLPDNSTGDHIIPLSAGGVDNATNYLPLCRSCTSSKGKRDLLAWWTEKGWPVTNLSPDVMCAYTRLTYHHASADQLAGPTTPELLEILRNFARTLPSKAHITAFAEVGRPSASS